MSVKRCIVCGEPTKGHLGPYGQSKCLQGQITKLAARFEARFEDLEKVNQAREEQSEQFRQHAKLSQERQEGLLATIEALEEEVRGLRARTAHVSLPCGRVLVSLTAMSQ